MGLQGLGLILLLLRRNGLLRGLFRLFGEGFQADILELLRIELWELLRRFLRAETMNLRHLQRE